MPKLMINYPHLASQVFGCPLYVTQEVLAGVKSLLMPRMLGNQIEVMAADDLPDGLEPKQLEARSESQYRVEGLAVIPLHGILVARRSQIDNACTELTSYEWARAQIATALADERVKEIVLDINSGGGHAVGCKELADYIYAERSVKPITALVNFSAYSAAYFIASACSKVVVSETGGCGSVGVIMEHMEVSKWEEEVGLKFTTFYRGDRKKDGTPHEPLSDGAMAAINHRMDQAYDLFISSVARYRGLSVEQVKATEATLYSGVEAVNNGLADELANPQDYLNGLAASVAKRTKPAQSIGLRARAIEMQNLL
ncbi:S49 family peptidase [Aeromonas sp. WP2-W18-CRE-05]|uniref:S49 family peptidase n=1 Tax=Aeromonas sp. WP2-W18-CRE-05 TaxID=2675707 RepID=UPI0015DCA02D|nr:S49 family peptidase [Aeromonas sp. WP2-W18-CRE-05]BBQ24626.1 peptidase S49 [Aeromonas sp. WP2-W18-CRE-05]